ISESRLAGVSASIPRQIATAVSSSSGKPISELLSIYPRTLPALLRNCRRCPPDRNHDLCTPRGNTSAQALVECSLFSRWDVPEDQYDHPGSPSPEVCMR